MPYLPFLYMSVMFSQMQDTFPNICQTSENSFADTTCVMYSELLGQVHVQLIVYSFYLG